MESDAHKAWMIANTVIFSIRLFKKSDADLLAAIDGKQKVTELKRLARIGLQHDRHAENAAYSHGFLCSACGAEETDPEEYNYCPRCGRKIANE